MIDGSDEKEFPRAKSRYIFFVDIVGSSKPRFSDAEKARRKTDLNNMIQQCNTYQSVNPNEMFLNHTGDGLMIAVGNTTFPIDLSIELHDKLTEYNKEKNPDHVIKVRIGMNVGPVVETQVIGGIDISGDTVELAKRVMDAGNEDHILLSSKISKELLQLDEKYQNIIHPLRKFTFKHGVQDELFSAYGKGFGNNIPPEEKTEQLSNILEKEVKTSPPTIEKIHPITLVVKSNMAVYSIGSKVYLRAKLPSAILDEPLTFSVYNSEKKLLVFRKINPAKYDNLELKRYGLYQIYFRVKGKDWKINELYTIIAKHGLAESQDSFVIDRREPVIMTDRGIYLLNSTMIVTIIDPDENKDSQEINKIGDRNNSCLTISTSFGKISKFRLVETGKNTGIFQGKIKILSPRYSKNKKKFLGKVKGKGPVDGEISCRKGEQIFLTYSKPEKTVQLSAFTSQFGATISLDSKTYTCGYVATITVLAPDYNYDHNKIDFVGDKPDNKITISTNVDSISNYKLRETGKDTGMFVGDVFLTCLSSLRDENQLKRIKKIRGNGPRNTKLVADKNDKLKVKFETNAGTYEDSADIK